ncbi:Eco57I restriction-modification methylase domain-containing protein [Flavobacterium nitrogenifigens]|uniref:site-specific DNA-methyltransferase (adenine-specific) n=1 Tax=Flavobacterium nitrogenifigens TaxID=1617283 RepID=A0A521DRF8_9FLAO|nr:N-6 DNA methylase [Flavobacterium nitrogenifigens]KAF2327480.1 N-6 DNA methylase [Flavobacterium nitrogenifigens]SMO74287.1 N-6 DNA Methylase [Flavobacterium nitrogenifigens]
MKQEALRFLKAYSFDPYKIDRLLVSAFLYSRKILSIENENIKRLLITENCDDYISLQNFLRIQELSTFEDLIKAFEFVISPEDKVITGAIYTPDYIRNYILDNTFSNYSNFDKIKICDPACGCAGFLFNAAKKLKSLSNRSYSDIFKSNIFGLDIQEYSINRSEILLSLLAINDGEDKKKFKFNLFNGNALIFEWNKKILNFKGFDIVIGNPPYVCSRNIDLTTKEYLKFWSVCLSGHPDLYIPFFEIGLSVLKRNGILGYITMNTFFKSVNGRALREYFQREKNKFVLIDFGGTQIFNSKSAYTCICLIKKTNSRFLEYLRLTNPKELDSLTLDLTKISYSSLESLNGWNLQKMDLLNKIESIGVPLGEKFKTRNGIATLKNDIYIFDPIKEDDKYFYLENGGCYPIEKEICREIINPNKLIKINSIDSLKKKIIFPYYYEKETPKLIKENDLKSKYPKAYNYLRDKKDILETRDKGNGKYENWFAYGRNQSLEKLRYKLFFPHITPMIPNFVLNLDENLLFHNGLALISDNERDLLFMQKIMSSKIFWFYVINSSKPYGAGYFSLSRNYIKRFGVYDFTENEINQLIEEDDEEKINDFIGLKYGIDMNLLS